MAGFDPSAEGLAEAAVGLSRPGPSTEWVVGMRSDAPFAIALGDGAAFDIVSRLIEGPVRMLYALEQTEGVRNIPSGQTALRNRNAWFAASIVGPIGGISPLFGAG